MGYSFRLAARLLLYASSHRQDDTYHDLCYTSRGALAGTRNSSMGPLQPEEDMIEIRLREADDKNTIGQRTGTVGVDRQFGRDVPND